MCLRSDVVSKVATAALYRCCQLRRRVSHNAAHGPKVSFLLCCHHLNKLLLKFAERPAAIQEDQHVEKNNDDDAGCDQKRSEDAPASLGLSDIHPWDLQSHRVVNVRHRGLLSVGLPTPEAPASER